MRAEGAPENFWGYTKAKLKKKARRRRAGKFLMVYQGGNAQKPTFLGVWIWKKIKLPLPFSENFCKK